MADFKSALDVIIRNESSDWSGDPDDHGNYFKEELVGSKFGITPWAYYKHYNYDVEPTIDIMQNLSLEQATEIYQQDYWNKVMGDNIQDQSNATIIFDAIVNEGIYAGIIGVQKIVGAVKDGIFGIKTLAALNNFVQSAFFNAYKQWRLAQYLAIAKNDNNSKFYQGWLARLNKFHYPETI